MIPWRDHSFLKDEDDIQLAEDLERLAEEPVTGSDGHHDTYYDMQSYQSMSELQSSLSPI